MSAETGKWIIGIGASVMVVGALIWFLGDRLSFLGRLPGDIRVERENFRFYFPITTMILISILLNLAIRVWHWWKGS